MAKKKLLLEDLKTLAIARGGDCLSTVVNSCRDYLEWECAKRHVWLAQAYCIKNTKQWCPTCAKNSKSKLK